MLEGWKDRRTEWWNDGILEEWEKRGNDGRMERDKTGIMEELKNEELETGRKEGRRDPLTKARAHLSKFHFDLALDFW